MSTQTVTLEGKQFVIVPREEYDFLLRKARIAKDIELPRLPEPNANGCYPAVEYGCASLARKLIRRRWSAGLTQKELARLAGVRPETLNRLERGKTVPTAATVDRLIKVLERVEREARRAK